MPGWFWTILRMGFLTGFPSGSLDFCISWFLGETSFPRLLKKYIYLMLIVELYNL